MKTDIWVEDLANWVLRAEALFLGGMAACSFSIHYSRLWMDCAFEGRQHTNLPRHTTTTHGSWNMTGVEGGSSDAQS